VAYWAAVTAGRMVFAGAVLVCLAAALGFGPAADALGHAVASSSDPQCNQLRAATGTAPAQPVTAADWLAVGDAEFDRGDCDAAVAAYGRAVAADPAYAAAYNNRAYTRMRQRRYDLALPDLDRAIELRPDYVHALMNRGDIYNYYYAIDKPRAVADYDRILALGPAARRGTSVCGHRMLAANGGWGPQIFLGLATQGAEAGCRD
jgi:tetratricopeptide (TPR) repeat protein